MSRAVVRGAADLAAVRATALAGRARGRCADPARGPARGEPLGHHLLRRAQHADRAVRRRARPPGAQLRGRPGAAARLSPSARASAQVTCQVLPPDFPATGATARTRLRPNRAASGPLPISRAPEQLVRGLGHRRATPSRSGCPKWIQLRQGRGPVPRLGARQPRLQGPAPRSRPIPLTTRTELRAPGAASAAGTRTSPRPAGSSSPTLTCGALQPGNARERNFAEFCDPAIDREIARAESLQTSDPAGRRRALGEDRPRPHRRRRRGSPSQTASRSSVDSNRVGNYQYNPQWGTLLDQLWVR